MQLLTGEMLLQTCSFLGTSVMDWQRKWRCLNSGHLIFKFYLFQWIQGKLWLILWRVKMNGYHQKCFYQTKWKSLLILFAPVTCETGNTKVPLMGIFCPAKLGKFIFPADADSVCFWNPKFWVCGVKPLQFWTEACWISCKNYLVINCARKQVSACCSCSAGISIMLSPGLVVALDTDK